MALADPSAGPYRQMARVPRFVCIVCWKSMATHEGPCPTCNVPRLDLARAEVREQVRLEAERRLQKSMYREYSFLALTSGALVTPAMWWLGSLAFALVPPVTMVVARLYARLRKRSAIATFASRRRRISAELGVDVQVDELDYRSTQLAASLPESVAIDPLGLQLEPLLEWLGCRLDDR